MGRKPTPDKTRDRRNPATSAKAVAGLADRLGPRCAAPGRDRISPVATRYRQDLYAAAVCGLLLLAVLAVFLPTVGYDFVNFDDNEYVYDNPHVANGLTAEGFVWAFTTAHANNWHPLTWLSHALDCQLYDLQPWGHHLTNVLLHAATAILLFLVLWRMTGDLWPSAFVAAVFAVHPLRAESVAWVSERKDVLSGLFFMLTLGAYMSYVRGPFSVARYLTVFALFALGLMAKPTLVTLPFVLLLLDYWPLGRISLPARLPPGAKPLPPGSQAPAWESTADVPKPELGNEAAFSILPWLVVEKLPLLALSAVSCVITPLAQGAAIEQIDVLPLSARMANAVVSYAAYLGQLVCPFNLAPFYPRPEDGLPAWQIAGALLLVAGLTAGAVALARRRPWLPVGWFWYLGMLVPVIGLVQVGEQTMADRYTYLPQIGVMMALTWAARQALASWPPRALACGAVSALIVAMLAACASQQTSVWRNSETLWTRALACTSNNALAQYNLGLALADAGHADGAILHFTNAVTIKPDYVAAHNNLGVALSRQGRFGEAIAEYDKALKIRPDYAAAHVNLGVAFARQKKSAEAMAEYHTALQLDPDYADAYDNLGVVLYDRGDLAAAAEQYRRALEINPRSAQAHYNLGNALAAQRQFDEALDEHRKAIEIKPDYADARYNSGVILYQRGRIREAIGQWGEMVRLWPDNTLALGRLAQALATSPDASLRNGSQAIELAQRAAALTRGQDPTILDALAAAYAESGRFSEAVQTAEQALVWASRQNNTALAGALRARLNLYQTGSPYRDVPQWTAAGSSRP